MIPVKALSVKEKAYDDGEHRERDDFLDDFQLHKGEYAAVAFEADAIGGYSETVLDEGDAPGESDDADEWPVGADAGLLETKVTVPGKCHEDVARHEQEDGLKCRHVGLNEK